MPMVAKRRKCLACRENPRTCVRHGVPYAARPDWRGQWELLKGQYVEAVWIRMMRDPYNELHAYYRKTDGWKWGELLSADWKDPIGADWISIAPERIPCGTKVEISRWLDRYAGTLEVIPGELFK